MPRRISKNNKIHYIKTKEIPSIIKNSIRLTSWDTPAMTDFSDTNKVSHRINIFGKSVTNFTYII